MSECPETGIYTIAYQNGISCINEKITRSLQYNYAYNFY